MKLRIQYFYPFQNFSTGKNHFQKLYNWKIIGKFHCLFPIKRKDKYPVYGLGSQWFSITDEFAQYVVSKIPEILKNFKMTFISDEIFLQTIWLNSPFVNEENKKYDSQKQTDHISKIYFDVARAIDFKRGGPYTYKAGDFDYLINTNCLFARKFDEKISGKLIDEIVEYVKS